MTKDMKCIVNQWEKLAKRRLELKRKFREQLTKEGVQTHKQRNDLSDELPNSIFPRKGWGGGCKFQAIFGDLK